jgi:hypothetical protein
MIVIKANQDRTVNIPGVANPVPRPVDIDSSTTGFKSLRTLRIYRFNQGSVIEGHAEEDEVFVIVLAGAVELTIIVDPATESPVYLSAPSESGIAACAAYLPPQAAYRLTAQSDADVAYVRATPDGVRSPGIFFPWDKTDIHGTTVLLEEKVHAERLRLLLISMNAQESEITFDLGSRADNRCESLVFIQSTAETNCVVALARESTAAQSSDCFALNSWDTLAFPLGSSVNLSVARGSDILALVVSAV